MASVSASQAKVRLQSLIDEVAASHQPVHITGKANSGVLVSAEDWAAIQETLHLLSVPGMRESILKGMKTPVVKCSRKLKW